MALTINNGTIADIHPVYNPRVFNFESDVEISSTTITIKWWYDYPFFNTIDIDLNFYDNKASIDISEYLKPLIQIYNELNTNIINYIILYDGKETEEYSALASVVQIGYYDDLSTIEGRYLTVFKNIKYYKDYPTAIPFLYSYKIDGIRCRTIEPVSLYNYDMVLLPEGINDKYIDVSIEFQGNIVYTAQNVLANKSIDIKTNIMIIPSRFDFNITITPKDSVLSIQYIDIYGCTYSISNNTINIYNKQRGVTPIITFTAI